MEERFGRIMEGVNKGLTFILSCCASGAVLSLRRLNHGLTKLLLQNDPHVRASKPREAKVRYEGGVFSWKMAAATMYTPTFSQEDTRVHRPGSKQDDIVRL